LFFLKIKRLLISGGQGFGDIDDCIIHEEFAYGCSGIGSAILTNNLGVSCEFFFFKIKRLLISGGQGFGDIDDCIIHEEFAYGCCGIGSAILANNFGVNCG